jgi:hypothetical protein
MGLTCCERGTLRRRSWGTCGGATRLRRSRPGQTFHNGGFLFDAHLADSLARSPSVPPLSHTDYANAHQTGFPQSRLRFRLWSSDHKLTRRRQSTHLRMQRAIARLHPKRPYLHQVKVVLELCNQVVLAFEQAGALHLVATQEFDRLQLQEVLLGPRWIEDD